MNVISIAIAISVILALVLYFSYHGEPNIAAEPLAQEVIHPVISGAIVRAEPVAAPIPTAFVVEQTYYSVRPGDTLTKIARRSCNVIGEIALENHISNQDLIYEYQVLVLKKVQQCSPRMMVKAKPFPENVSHVHGGASREKISSEPEQFAHIDTAILSDCGRVIRHIKERLEKILVGTKCIEDNYGDIVREAISKIDPRIHYSDVVSMIYIESNGSANAVNVATDCHGLMQLQTPTARGVGVSDIYNPRENIFGGVRVLARYTYDDFHGSRAHGLAAYNMGNGKLRQVISKWPAYNPETRNHYFLEVERIRAIIETRGA